MGEAYQRNPAEILRQALGGHARAICPSPTNHGIPVDAVP